MAVLVIAPATIAGVGEDRADWASLQPLDEKQAMHERPCRLQSVVSILGVALFAICCGENSTGALRGVAGSVAQAGAWAAEVTSAGASGRASSEGRGGNRFDQRSNDVTQVEPGASLEYRACVQYTEAQCRRRFVDCGERASTEEPCRSSLDRCPDLLFSPGSTWTVDSLNACASAWERFSCDEIRQNKRPACAEIRGTKQLEETCLFPNQCASGACTKFKKDGTRVEAFPNCGLCGIRSDLGGPCDQPGYECAPELVCGAAKLCVAKAARGVIGAPCTDNSTCGGYGISCRTDPADGGKRCLLWPEVGQSCSEGFECVDGSFCQSGVCVSAPTLGQSCGTKGPAQCAAALVCSGRFEAEAYACVAPRKLGEACVGEIRRAPRGNCEVGLRCDCGELDCDLRSGVCRQPRREGESCTEQHSSCEPGTSCVDGICIAAGLQAAVQKLCPAN